MDRWPSGRRRTPGKCVGGRPSPGFESLSVRHHILIIPVSGISGAIPAQDQGFTTALWGLCFKSPLILEIITAKPQPVILRGWVFPCFSDLTRNSARKQGLFSGPSSGRCCIIETGFFSNVGYFSLQ